jgi:hypothetical protein
VALTVCASLSAAAAPVIEFEKTVVDLGKVQAGKKVTASFPFKNAGDQTLQITRISGSCGGCTSLKATLTTVQPGQSAAIEAAFTTPSGGGSISKRLRVETNDPARPSVSLAVKGESIPIATLSPKRLNVGKIRTKSTVDYTVTITPTKPEGFSILRIEPGRKFATAPGFSKSADGTGSYIVTVRVQSGDRPGRIYESLKVLKLSLSFCQRLLGLPGNGHLGTKRGFVVSGHPCPDACLAPVRLAVGTRVCRKNAAGYPGGREQQDRPAAVGVC